MVFFKLKKKTLIEKDIGFVNVCAEITNQQQESICVLELLFLVVVMETKENLRKYNEYDLSGEYGIGKIDNSDITFLFDKEDYDKIKDICWHVHSAGYIYGTLDGKDISFHRYVMDAKKGEVVDHINHKVRDNRKSNLRICTQNDNVINKKQLPTVGVRQAKSGRWFAELTAYKKYHWLGTYDTKEEAIEARKKGEEKYFGEYAYKEET